MGKQNKEYFGPHFFKKKLDFVAKIPNKWKNGNTSKYFENRIISDMRIDMRRLNLKTSFKFVRFAIVKN